MQKREILKLTPPEGRKMIENYDEFEVIYDKLSAQNRWSTEHEIVLMRKKDGKYFLSFYQVGSTEAQDEAPYDSDPYAIFQEVMPVKKTIIAYEWRPNNP